MTNQEQLLKDLVALNTSKELYKPVTSIATLGNKLQSKILTAMYVSNLLLFYIAICATLDFLSIKMTP